MYFALFFTVFLAVAVFIVYGYNYYLRYRLLTQYGISSVNQVTKGIDLNEVYTNVAVARAKAKIARRTFIAARPILLSLAQRCNNDLVTNKIDEFLASIDTSIAKSEDKTARNASKRLISPLESESLSNRWQSIFTTATMIRNMLAECVSTGDIAVHSDTLVLFDSCVETLLDDTRSAMEETENAVVSVKAAFNLF